MTEEVKAEQEEEVTLSPREEAIARGEDPDEAVDEPVDEPVDESVNDELNEVDDADLEVTHEDDTTRDEEDGGSGKPEEKSDEKPDWVTDDIRGFATQYGLSEEDLTKFSGFDQFDAMTRVAQKLYEHDSGEAGKEETKEETKEEDDFLDPDEYKAKDFNEETVKVVDAVRKMQEWKKGADERLRKREEELDNMVAAVKREQEVEQVNKYHDIVDKHRPDFYGKTIDQKGNLVRLDKEHADRRVKLFRAIERVAAYHAGEAELSGSPGALPDRESLVREAESLAFGREVEKWENRSKGQRLRSQSNRRRGVGGTRRPVASFDKEPLNENDEAEALANDPDLVKLWDDAQRAI